MNKEFAEKMKEAEVRENQQKDEILALKESLKLLEIKNNQLSQDIVEIESKNRELSAIKCTFQKSEFLVESMRKERDEFKQKVNNCRKSINFNFNLVGPSRRGQKNFEPADR